jgi:hypothetical protein
MQESTNLSLEKDDAENLSFVEFSCPQCFKVQKAAAVELNTPQNFFKCVRCKTLFCFDWPNTSAKRIQTLIVPEESTKFIGLLKGISKLAQKLDFTSQGEMLDSLPIALRRSSKIAKFENKKISFLDHWLYYRWKNKERLNKFYGLPWTRYLDIGLWVVPAAFIMVGIIMISHRNFIGIGLSLIALRIGLTILIR